MTKTQRQLLQRLMRVTSQLGGNLDGTATSVRKFIDRQQAHSKVSSILYYVFLDHKDNDTRKEDIQEAFEQLCELEELAKKNYPDRNGNF